MDRERREIGEEEEKSGVLGVREAVVVEGGGNGRKSDEAMAGERGRESDSTKKVFLY